MEKKIYYIESNFQCLDLFIINYKVLISPCVSNLALEITMIFTCNIFTLLT